MKIALISYHYRKGGHTRPSTLERAFTQLGLEYRIFHADFEHISKKRQSYPGESRLRAVAVPAYRRNISLGRIFSHLVFTLKLLWKIEEITEDCVYICTPPTSSLLLVPALKSRGKRVIVDFVDLWPDALPLGGLPRDALELSVFPLWRAIRDGLSRQADLVLAVNRYFLSKLHLVGVRSDSLPLTNDPAELAGCEAKIRPPLSDELRIAFLGSLNHVTDTEALAQLLGHLAQSRPTRLLVLGGGEGMPKLRNLLANTTVTLEDRGISFDPAQKRALLEDCHFGFNGYKSSSEVALSYKSIDYLAAGVPIINNAKGDLWELIATRACGLNFDAADPKRCAQKILALNEEAFAHVRASAHGVYRQHFTPEAFTNRLQTFLAGKTP